MIILSKEECPQGMDAWFEAKRGIPSASHFGSLLTPKTLKLSAAADDYRAQLLGEWLAGPEGWRTIRDDEDFITRPMSRGWMLQPEALAFYQFQSQHEVDVEEVGFVYADEHRLWGCSPDGLVLNVGQTGGSHVIGGIEIKCRLTKQHMKFMMTGEVPTSARGQLQGSMLCCQTDWWDYEEFHPQLHGRIERVHRDEKYIAALSAAIAQFTEQLLEDREALKARGFQPAMTDSKGG